MRQLLLFFVAFIMSLTVYGQMLPPNTRIIYFGDSQTSFSYNSTGNSVQYQNFGYVPWVMSLCPALTMPKGGILAVPGETTNQMINRLGPIATFDAKLMVVLAGTNDPLYAISPATTKANLRKIYDAGIAAGSKVIAITILPRFAQNTYSPPVEAARIGINDWIKSQTDVVVVDAENALNGPEYFEDGLHTSPAGAFALGKKVAEAVNKLVEPCLPGSANAAQLTVSANSNPLMAGTAGRFSNATGATNTSGVVANGWLLAGNFSGTASVTGSKEAAENGREKQVITIAGNYTGNSRRVTFNNYATPPIALYGGQVVEGIAEIELPFPLVNIRSMYLKLQAYAPEYASTLAEAYSLFPTSNKSMVMEPGRYLMRTPPMTIDPGTVGQLTTQIVIEFNAASNTEPVALTMKISSIGIRQLPLAQGPQANLSPVGDSSLCPGKTLLLNASTGEGYSYQWFFNDTAVRDSTGASFSASSPGSYKVHVSKPGCIVASKPVVLSAADCMVNTITTDSLPTELCIGQALAVPFSKTGPYDTANVFTLQLSDTSGSFDKPVAIGSLKDTAAGLITAVWPDGVTSGNRYRVRVVSSHPVIEGTVNPQDITIRARPLVTLNPADSATAYPNFPVTLTASSSIDSVSYQWLVDGMPVAGSAIRPTYVTNQAGNYQVVVRSNGGCADTSSVTKVRLASCAAIELTLSDENDSSFTVAAVGGLPPYQYSLDSSNFQQSGVFFKQPNGQAYTVYVKDSVNCTGRGEVVLSRPTPTLATGSLPQSLCSGQLLTVPFSVSGLFDSTNVFTVQLSDGAGSFANPMNIGTLAGDTGGAIQTIIPSEVAAGTGYRVRVTGSSPVVTGTAAPEPIRISITPDAQIDPADSVTTYPHLPVTLTAFPQGTCTYQWMLDGNQITENGTELTYTTSQPGNYQVIVVSDEGCADTSSVTRVQLFACNNIVVSIGNQNDSSLMVKATGGVPPYQYSLDSSRYQFSNVFTNLPYGRDYTVYVKDSVNCVGQLEFTLRRQSEYETQNGSGSRNTLLITQQLGSTPGIVVVAYDMFTRPDQMEIYCNNELKATTGGPVGGKGWLWFNYQPSEHGPYECGIRMYAPEEGAEWVYTPLRPIGQFQAMRTGSDTVTATTFVSPNFPNAIPADSTLVHSFTPAVSGSRLRVDFKALLLDHGVLSIYDGADTTAPLLATYTGLYGQDQNPSLTASNPSGQLTFKFVNSDTAGRFGWIANLYSPSGIRTFYPQTATAGDTVTIVGDGFYDVSSVRFGEQAARSFEVLSDTLIRAVVAGGKSGEVEVNTAGRLVRAGGFMFYSEIQSCPGNTQLLNAPNTGSTYQWQVSTGNGSFADLQDGELYSGATSATLQIPNISSSFYGYQYRCVVNGLAGDVQTLKFISTWVGGHGTDWETAANWSCGMVPEEGMDVVIPAGAKVEVNVSTTIRNLKLQKDATVTLKPDVRLQVGK